MCFPELTGARQVVSTATFQSLPNKQQILQELLLHANQIIFFNSILCQQNFLERWSWLAWLSFSCILCPVFLFCWVGSFCKKWPHASHRAEVRSAYSHKGVPELSDSCPSFGSKLSQNCLKVSQSCFKVVSKLSQNCATIVSKLSQVVPKSFPCSSHLGCQVVSIRFPRGHEMGWVSEYDLVDVAGIASNVYIHWITYGNVVFEDRWDLKKWGGAGSVEGGEGYDLKNHLFRMFSPKNIFYFQGGFCEWQ